MPPQLSWDEISEIIHKLKDDRTVIMGFIMRAQIMDRRIKEIIDKLEDLILRHEDE